LVPAASVTDLGLLVAEPWFTLVNAKAKGLTETWAFWLLLLVTLTLALTAKTP
jgi:hypothetical protein